MFLPRIFAVLLFAASLASAQDPQWIWHTDASADGEVRYFRKTFTLAAQPTEAALAVACDNRAMVFVNGVEVGRSTAWQQPLKARVARLLKPGENLMAVRGTNEDGVAALVARLEIQSPAGRTLIVSDATWLSSDKDAPDWSQPGFADAAWSKPFVRGQLGSAPWGDALSGGAAKADEASAAPHAAGIQVPPGFQIDLLYSVPKATQGSWVSMTDDPQGRLIAGDQYGKLYRVTVPPVGATDGTKVEALPCDISGAHGLLFAFDSLYVMVNENSMDEDGVRVATGRPPGLWRLKYQAATDSFGEPELLQKFEGSGEHGTHGLVLGPDGRSIYFANGNHTRPPARIDVSRPVAMGEDHLITRLWDANGHAKGILAPGGYVGKTDADGKRVELFAGGFRNQYDLAFDANGELFTYDSDMEWDIGTPWYMPTRINHIVSGGDYGWRSGAGRWPEYYADSLPAAVDIGPGSPTGTVFGTGAKFPAKYQRAMFALDWTYATVWAIHFTPDGASFRAEKEDFISGRGFSVTDAIVRRQDGALYLTTGGRRNQSALYRVTYTGPESTAPAAPPAPTGEAKVRHSLEALHVATPGAVEQAWPHLASGDRFLRFAARVAIEHQPAAEWAGRALAEKNPQAAIEALIALARVGDKTLQPRVLAALGGFDFDKLPAGLHLPLLRAWELAFTRMGKPAPEVCAQVAAKLEPLFPNADPLASRELLSLLVFLDSPTVVARTVPLLDTAPDAGAALASDAVLARNDNYARAVDGMHASRPNRQAIACAYALREARAGWTPELRRAFFGWFPRTQGWKGGNSFTKFLENIRKDALANCVTDASERTALDTLSKQAPPAAPADRPMPKGPGRSYTVEEVVTLGARGLKERNFAQGKAMYAATLCVNCHKLGGDGGNIGPDLTGAGQRYTLRDLMENIIEPSKVISDQYDTEQIEMKDGSLVVGRVLVEENGKLFVMTSALAPDVQTTVDAAKIKSRKPFQLSMMPPGLINALNKDELLDLVAYLQSGGNADDKVFAPGSARVPRAGRGVPAATNFP